MSSLTKPAFVLVPGAFCPGTYFHKVADILEAQGYETVSIDLPTLGPESKIPAPSLYDDGDYVRSIVVKLLESGKDVILCANSYGGSVIYEACKGITKDERSGNSGGQVRHLVLLNSLLAPKDITVAELLGIQNPSRSGAGGSPTPYSEPPPSSVMQYLLFDSLPDSDKKYYGSMGRPQSVTAMTVPMTFAAYEVVPTTLVISKKDRALDVRKQEDSFDVAVKKGIKGLKKVYLDSDHCSMLSHPKEVAQLLLEAAADDTTPN